MVEFTEWREKKFSGFTSFVTSFWFVWVQKVNIPEYESKVGVDKKFEKEKFPEFASGKK